jgi:hypothetical protein
VSFRVDERPVEEPDAVGVAEMPIRPHSDPLSIRLAERACRHDRGDP